MKKSIIIFAALLFSAAYSDAGELITRSEPVTDTAYSGAENPQIDGKKPEDNLAVTSEKQAPPAICAERTKDSPVSVHKLNYISINHLPGDNDAQVKFQISMKFQVLQPNLYVFEHNLFPAFVAYTQKSLWNVGKNSTPFEETNYNPEFFLDYPVNAALFARVKLRNIVVGLLEHESNGLDKPQSRSWNRQYVQLRFGLEPNEKMEITNSFIADRALLYIKLWYASGYSDQEDYLLATGNNSKFLDYMGHGEIGISVRNFLWTGLFKNHQLDIKTPIFHDMDKSSCELEFRQQIPGSNFALYLQYWYGYGETLLRFDQFGHRGFAGLSFSY